MDIPIDNDHEGDIPCLQDNDDIDATEDPQTEQTHGSISDSDEPQYKSSSMMADNNEEITDHHQIQPLATTVRGKNKDIGKYQLSTGRITGQYSNPN